MKTQTCLALISLAFLGLLAGCSSSSSGGASPPPPPPPPPPVVISAAGIWTGQAVTPDVADIVTSFEFDDPDGFVLGNAPFTADFQGGITESRGIGALYTDGAFSWHIDANDGAIDFAVPGDAISFSIRTVTAGDDAIVRVLDEFGIQITAIVVPDAFTQLVVNRDTSIGQSRIAQVQVIVTTGEIVMDSFSFGFPSTASNDDVGCLFATNNEFVCVLNDGVTGDFISGANGVYQVNGDQVTGSGNLYAVPGETLADDSTIAPLTINAGTVVEDTSLGLTIDIFGLPVALTSTFDTDFDRPSDLATVAAVYTTFDLFGDASSFAIDAGGVISGQSASGCNLSGQVSVIDSATNAYDVNLLADAATCGSLGGDYDGLGISSDDTVMDDAFTFLVFVDGQSMIAGEAVK